jgi:hypothetical protein
MAGGWACPASCRAGSPLDYWTVDCCGQPRPIYLPRASALVFEADLEVDAVLDDLAVSTMALDFTTSTVLMLRTVREAVATAWRAASLHDFGLVPTISLMMITPISISFRLARLSGQSSQEETGAAAGVMVPARTLSKQVLQ